MTMCASLVLLGLCLAAVTGAPGSVPSAERIVGGSLTTIENYPFQAALLTTHDQSTYNQVCGGTILNSRSILTAAHCFIFTTALNIFRVRVGSSFASSGGVVHNVNQIIFHPHYNPFNNFDNDVAIARLAFNIDFNNQARAGAIAGPNYNVADNQAVWAVGWGAEMFQGPPSEQLRHVQIWTVTQAVCRERYAELGYGGAISDNMLCAGWLDVGGRDQCTGDAGGPLLHNGVVVGVSAWGRDCGLPRYPGVNIRVSRFSQWIQDNA